MGCGDVGYGCGVGCGCDAGYGSCCGYGSWWHGVGKRGAWTDRTRKECAKLEWCGVTPAAGNAAQNACDGKNLSCEFVASLRHRLITPKLKIHIPPACQLDVVALCGGSHNGVPWCTPELVHRELSAQHEQHARKPMLAAVSTRGFCATLAPQSKNHCLAASTRAPAAAGLSFMMHGYSRLCHHRYAMPHVGVACVAGCR